jgi:hypothetical protein
VSVLYVHFNHTKEIILRKKVDFEIALKEFVKTLQSSISSEDGQWTIKGFIDIYKNIYTISSDTKIISKILEIHIFPKLLELSEKYGYRIVLADHQNYYPDISFVDKENSNLRFAVDFKTTYRQPNKPYLCNGFTLGSHGKYFQDRTSTKNIQFPYGSYAGHYCLGIIYDRVDARDIDETKILNIDSLTSITSVVGNFNFFVAEKWSIASDKSGSGNTANIGSINNIEDIVQGKGTFSKLGEDWFDDYWMNYNKITINDGKGGTKKINNIKDFVNYRNGDVSLIVSKNNSAPKKVTR